MGDKRKKNGTQQVKGALTVVNIAELRNRLGQWLADASVCALDLSRVGEIDSAGFQLLAALKHEAENTGKTFRITAFSPAVSSVLKLFNMEEYFGMDDASLGVHDDETGENAPHDKG